jgi:hypothetical protein
MKLGVFIKREGERLLNKNQVENLKQPRKFLL